ncbi:unnamed protein product [Sympodiomycopsis kandeliae]
MTQGCLSWTRRDVKPSSLPFDSPPSTFILASQHHIMTPKTPYPVLASEEARPVRGLSVRSQDERRLNDFTGGQYSDYNLTSVLFEDRSDASEVISLEKWSPKIGEKPPFSVAKKQRFVPSQKGDAFGPSWSNHWMRITINVPKKWQDKEWVELEFDPSCEALIFTEDGKALQGITGGFDDRRRVDFPLKGDAKTKKTIFYAEISCNGMFGVESDASGDPDPDRFFVLNSADIVVKRPQAWRLLWDWDILRGCVQQMPKDSVLQNKALWTCNQIMNTFRKNDLSTIDRCRQIAQEILGKDWEESGADIYKHKDDHGPPALFSVGHTHIDTAWLWPFSSTQQKIARSWSTQLDLMDRYPEYKFTASTAQQFDWLEKLYPDLFERIKKQVKAGRFIPIGATWVENDANIPSGEAFVRQFVYGQRYFESRFGKRCDIFWLPDSFGYNAQIPQLARGAGCDYWFTQKLSWSNINKFPHNSFVWVGLDGTQIITHMTPVDNYDSRCGVDDVRKGVWNNKNLNVQPAALHLYGHGDGGGGPTAEMLERLRRARATYNAGFVDMPKVAVGHDARDFFDHVLEITDKGQRLPTWQGEIYLEFHRGVQTSHGSIKKWNRKLEVLLHNVEWVATLASIRKSDYVYPKEQIDDLWEPFLKCQFHDVLPGSSIRLVYEDAEKIYADVDKKARTLLHSASKALSGKGSDIPVAVNTLGIPRRELVPVKLEGRNFSETQMFQQSAVQMSSDGKTAFILAEDLTNTGLIKACPSPAMVMVGTEAASARQTSNGDYTLRSSYLNVTLSHGRITSIYDKIVGKELLASGRTAGLTIYEDYTAQFDAWDTDLWSLDTREEVKFDNLRLEVCGPWRASIAATAKVGKSTITLLLSLDAVPATLTARNGQSRGYLNIQAEVDWQEKHRFLRFEVPTNLQTDTASFETQYGITKRPTVRNTTWDAAKFEVCGHKFSDISESNYGFAILNDCKYGHSAEVGLLRISLLRAATYPDAHQDEGHHSFAFALYPHDGALADSDVVQAARLYNNPIEAIDSNASSVKPDGGDLVPFALEPQGGKSDNIVFDTLKRGEADFDYYGKKGQDGKTVIARFYESLGSQAEVVLKVDASKVSKIVSCSLLEDDEDDLEDEFSSYVNAEDDTTRIALSFRAFQVRTVKLYIKE